MPERFTSRTTWREKLERGKDAKVVRVTSAMLGAPAKGTILIPRPLDVDALVRTVRKGRLVTPTAIRRRLARDHEADAT